MTYAEFDESSFKDFLTESYELLEQADDVLISWESDPSNKNYVNGIMSLPATGAIIQSVGQTKGAIGYVGLAYINKSVKLTTKGDDQIDSGRN